MNMLQVNGFHGVHRHIRSLLLLSPRFAPSVALSTSSQSRGRKTSSHRRTTADGEVIPHFQGEALYGIHSVLQAMELNHRQLHQLYMRETTKAASNDSETMEKIKQLATERGISIQPLSKWMLNHITHDKPHQGVVLDASPLRLQEFQPQEPAGSTKSPLILALDELQDPQNFGAILRSAHFLGCAAVVVSERNSAPLSPAVSRASAGALDVLVAQNKLLRTKNLHQCLAISKDIGWRIVGACSGANSIPSHELGSQQPTILVMGNEHRGMRKGIRQCCDAIVRIGSGDQDASRVDSLNVSVATAILMYEFLKH